MRNYQIEALTEVLQRATTVVRRGDDGGEIYRRNLELLGGAVERGVKILRARQARLGGSSLARTGERPPFDVEVSTWREFVRVLPKARATWIAVCKSANPAELVNDDESLDGLGDVTATQVQTLSEMLRARGYAVQSQSRISNTSTAFINALARLNAGLREAAGVVGEFSTLRRGAPPTGITVPVWNAFYNTFEAARQTAQAAQSGSLSTGQARQPQRTATTPTSTATTPTATATPTATTPEVVATAETAASTGRRTRRSGRAGAAGIVPADLPAMPAAAEQPGAPGAAPPLPGQALGILDAWSAAFSTLMDTPSSLLPTRTPGLPVFDRLQDAITILNPTGVAVYERPWFWPSIVGVGGLIGYDYWRKAQAKKASAKPAAKTA